MSSVDVCGISVEKFFGRGHQDEELKPNETFHLTIPKPKKHRCTRGCSCTTQQATKRAPTLPGRRNRATQARARGGGRNSVGMVHRPAPARGPIMHACCHLLSLPARPTAGQHVQPLRGAQRGRARSLSPADLGFPRPQSSPHQSPLVVVTLCA